MLLDVILFFVCVLVLVAAANAFVNGAVAVGARFLSPLTLGSMVAVGTSLPVLVVLFAGMVQGRPELVVGAIVGYCLLNLGGYLAIAMLIRPARVSPMVAREIPLLIAVTGIFYFFLSTGPALSRGEGGILVMIFALIVAGAIVRGNRVREIDSVDEFSDTDLQQTSGRVIDIVRVLVALPILLVAGYLVVDSASNIGMGLQMEPAVVGITLVATAIVLPDLVVMLTATIKGEPDISFGNVIASNIVSLTAAAGIVASAFPIDISSRGIHAPEYPALIFLTLLLWPIARLRWRFGRVEGAVLLVFYGLIVAALFDLPFLASLVAG